jgi:hypothetical protein
VAQAVVAAGNLTRNSRVWVLLLACILAKPALAQTPDRAFHLLGTWTCKEISQSTSRWTFTRKGDNAIALHNEFRSASGETATFDETYRQNPKTGQWTWQATNGSAIYERGTAGPWNSRTWTFAGTIDVMRGQKSKPRAVKYARFGVRMIYTDLGNDALQREFQSLRGRNRTWTSYSIGTCRRV